MAAETSNVSYRTKMPEEALVAILASGEVPSAFTAHVSHLLDDAQAQKKTGSLRPGVWETRR